MWQGRAPLSWRPPPTQSRGKRPVKVGRVEPTRKWRLETADAVAGEGPPLMRRPSADAVAGNGGPLNWPPSADAVAGKRAAATPPVEKSAEKPIASQAVFLP